MQLTRNDWPRKCWFCVRVWVWVLSKRPQAWIFTLLARLLPANTDTNTNTDAYANTSSNTNTDCHSNHRLGCLVYWRVWFLHSCIRATTSQVTAVNGWEKSFEEYCWKCKFYLNDQRMNMNNWVKQGAQEKEADKETKKQTKNKNWK